MLLELDRDQMDRDRLEALSYRVFSTVHALPAFVDRQRREEAGEKQPSTAVASAFT